MFPSIPLLWPGHSWFAEPLIHAGLLTFPNAPQPFVPSVLKMENGLHVVTTFLLALGLPIPPYLVFGEDLMSFCSCGNGL